MVILMSEMDNDKVNEGDGVIILKE